MQIHQYILYALALLNALSFVAYAFDKLFAMWRWRRISERSLLRCSAGAPVGALLGMVVCRHKIRKARFWLWTILALVVQGGLLYWFVIR